MFDSKNNNKESGLINQLILIIVAILVLSYFGFDLRNIVNSPQAQSNLEYVKTSVVNFWNDYLYEPVSYFWNNIFLGIIWSAFTDNMDRIRDRQQTNMQAGSTTVNLGNQTQ